METIYFNKAGKENTEETLKLAKRVAEKEKAIEVGKKVIAVAGTREGVDTALVIRAARDFNDIVIEKLICKPC